MRLWTIQPKDVYDLILEKGVYTCDGNKSEFIQDTTTCMLAYEWLSEQMIMKGVVPEDESIKFPVWAWYRYEWKNEKPNIYKAHGFGRTGTPRVCMEIEIPDNKVILTDYDNWHCVLNNYYCDNSKNEAEWEKLHDEFDNFPPSKRYALRRESWQNIFDITPLKTSWRKNGEYVQATFWELRKEQIISAEEFVCQ